MSLFSFRALIILPVLERLQSKQTSAVFPPAALEGDGRAGAEAPSNWLR